MTKGWKQIIGKRLAKHVTQYCGGTLREFKASFVKARAAGHDCRECSQIAAKLKLFPPPKNFEFTKTIQPGVSAMVETPAGDVGISNQTSVEIYVHGRGAV